MHILHIEASPLLGWLIGFCTYASICFAAQAGLLDYAMALPGHELSQMVNTLLPGEAQCTSRSEACTRSSEACMRSSEACTRSSEACMHRLSVVDASTGSAPLPGLCYAKPRYTLQDDLSLIDLIQRHNTLSCRLIRSRFPGRKAGNVRDHALSEPFILRAATYGLSRSQIMSAVQTGYERRSGATEERDAMLLRAVRTGVFHVVHLDPSQRSGRNIYMARSQVRSPRFRRYAAINGVTVMQIEAAIEAGSRHVAPPSRTSAQESRPQSSAPTRLDRSMLDESACVCPQVDRVEFLESEDMYLVNLIWHAGRIACDNTFGPQLGFRGIKLIRARMKRRSFEEFAARHGVTTQMIKIAVDAGKDRDGT